MAAAAQITCSDGPSFIYPSPCQICPTHTAPAVGLTRQHSLTERRSLTGFQPTGSLMDISPSGRPYSGPSDPSLVHVPRRPTVSSPCASTPLEAARQVLDDPVSDGEDPIGECRHCDGYVYCDDLYSARSSGDEEHDEVKLSQLSDFD